MSDVDPRLFNLLGGEELAPLRRRLRRCFERTAPGAPPDLLRLGGLGTTERESLALLTGQPPRAAKSIQIDVRLLDAKLRDAGIADSLRDALERIDGPIVDLASTRSATLASWSATVATSQHPALADYLQSPAALGLLKRLARQSPSAAVQLLDAADKVLHRLPAGGLARAQLAAEALGNAHALDDGQACATLVLAAWRRIEKMPSGPAGPADPLDEFSAEIPDSASGNATDERTRDVWARAGVLVNELARPALLLNLPVGTGESPPGAPGEPAYLSLRRLLRAPPRWAVAGRPVFVCENPNLLAIAADRLGMDCAPLVCTDGMPAAAQRTLLIQLAMAGAQLRYHGDFDWPGIQIANFVMRTCGAQPWRFGTADYEAATRTSRTRYSLTDARIDASWDAALALAMERCGLAIAEESLAATLLADVHATAES
jgi:uncharacterized protein (TIGR02679 family)